MRANRISLFSMLVLGVLLASGCASSISPNPEVAYSFDDELGEFSEFRVKRSFLQLINFRPQRKHALTHLLKVD